MTVVVLGSINADRVCSVATLPAAGQTVLATAISLVAGGKGRNQAVAVAALGGEVRMHGAVGSDGGWLRDDLLARGVGVAGVSRVDGPSGSAQITVDAGGENTIVVHAGANARVAGVPPLAGARVLLCSLEVPLATVEAACRAARDSGVRTVVNAAPMHPDLGGILDVTDVLVVNETEARALLRGDPDEALVPALDAWRGARTVVLTLGSRGALAVGGAVVPAPRVDVVSTVGAGDAFTGALALRLAEGASVDEAVAFACAAGSVHVSGASLTRAAVTALG